MERKGRVEGEGRRGGGKEGGRGRWGGDEEGEDQENLDFLPVAISFPACPSRPAAAAFSFCSRCN